MDSNKLKLRLDDNSKVNPALTCYHRDDPAPVLPIRDEPDLLSWLEKTGRLIAEKDGDSQEFSTIEEEELSALMGEKEDYKTEDDASEDDWDAYYDSLSAALARCPPKAIAIIGSDANACIAAPRFNVVPVLCAPCSTPPLAEVLNMCNTTSELDVEHLRGPNRVQHVQHLFNTCLSQVLNTRKRDFSQPRAHWLSYPSIHGSSVCLCATVYVPFAEEVL